MSKQITIKQAAEILGVSPATVRNWIRLGKIKQVTRSGRVYELASAEINQLKQAINTGSLPYLKSRRNKQAITGRAVPANYLENKALVDFGESLMPLIRKLSKQGQLLVLLELYLKLLQMNGRISPNKTNLVLTEEWLAGRIEMGLYGGFAKEFWELCAPSSRNDLQLLREINSGYLQAVSGDDLLGLVYMAICSLRKRKNTGSYYTPSAVVKQLIASSFHYIDPLVLGSAVDPCCGSGNFLLHLFQFLKPRIVKTGLAEYEAELRLAGMLIGFDNDPIAVILTKMNLSLLFAHPELAAQVRIEQRDTLLEPNQNQYDLVIGNPPWGYRFTQAELQKLSGRGYQTIQAGGNAESFCLFIEWAVERVRTGGLISYVIPEAFLTTHFHHSARELILKSCRIRETAQLGMAFAQVNAPVITLIAEKTNRQRDLSELSDLNLSCFVYGKQRDRSIIEHLRTRPNIAYLKDKADFALGIVTGNNRRFLLTSPVDNSEPVISGRDLLHYNIKECSYHLVYQRELFQQVAPEEYYRAPEKLLYRFVHQRLVVAYDNHQRLSINSANILIPKLTGVSVKYVMAVLNSRVVQFYRTITNPDVKVLRSFLESIPIALCSESEQKEVIGLVDQILMSKNPGQRRRIYEEIDQKLMDLYGLSFQDQIYIRRKSQTVDLL